MMYASQPDAEQGKTILVVEDDVNIGELVALALNMETPHRVLYAPDAFQALKLVENHKPDLFILDYQLPQMTGLELYDHLQAQAAFRGVPALVMSANPPKEELQQRQLPSLDKPFEVEELVQTIEGLLGRMATRSEQPPPSLTLDRQAGFPTC